ncbi:unnamed protein product [Spodoptera littoralis]|uniref:Uncharacterized protein n=1 Tax=Spodoptera littoralis TaxID=7109 RepID=A0A9P0N0R7_SPOLI|nr:unnamed protein product [Spodoptera littoralis]CAH1640386.1 unnamed protein product [Spodoptera littoralis]
MKYFLAIALLVSVASAGMVKPTPGSNEVAQIQEIIAAILNPNTDPATAVALEEMLLDVLGVKPEPVAIGPAIIDYPLPEEAPVVPPSPAAEVAAPVPKSPLVQIIVNINHASADVSPVDLGPAIIPRPVPEPGHIEDIVPEPVHVVDAAPEPVEPVIIGEPILPSPAVVLPDILN